MKGTVVDADGHVMEDESIADYIEEPYRSKGQFLTMSRVFPNFDFHRLGLLARSPRAFGGGNPVGPKQWNEFIEFAELNFAVVYPIMGLAMGNISHPDWACAAARAYNNWLHDRFIGCEGGEAGLDYQVKRVGGHHFLFASDFPHEIGPEDILHEIKKVRDYPGLTDEDKQAILGGNATRFYRFEGKE